MIGISREDIIILAATNLYSSRSYTLEEAVTRALDVEKEVKKQRTKQFSGNVKSRFEEESR